MRIEAILGASRRLSSPLNRRRRIVAVDKARDARRHSFGLVGGTRRRRSSRYGEIREYRRRARPQQRPAGSVRRHHLVASTSAAATNPRARARQAEAVQSIWLFHGER